MARGKNVQLFLIDGNASGRTKCTLANWTGVAYKIPRIELEKCKDRNDLAQSGVYFLFGTSDKTGNNIVYVGQAGIRKNGEGILGRLKEHKNDENKDYWAEAVVFTTSNNSFGPTEITYLEHRFAAIAQNANRYEIKNANEPASGGTPTEEKVSELEEFIDHARMIMGVLGHKVFEPIHEPCVKVLSNGKSENHTFHLKRNMKNGVNVDASGLRTAEGFVVLKGSRMNMKDTPHINLTEETLRRNAKVDENGILQEDVLCKSPSAAGGFATGSSINGKTEWKTANGKTLAEIESEE